MVPSLISERVFCWMVNAWEIRKEIATSKRLKGLEGFVVFPCFSMFSHQILVGGLMCPPPKYSSIMFHRVPWQTPKLIPEKFGRWSVVRGGSEECGDDDSLRPHRWPRTSMKCWRLGWWTGRFQYSSRVSKRSDFHELSQLFKKEIKAPLDVNLDIKSFRWLLILDHSRSFNCQMTKIRCLLIRSIFPPAHSFQEKNGLKRGEDGLKARGFF